MAQLTNQNFKILGVGWQLHNANSTKLGLELSLSMISYNFITPASTCNVMVVFFIILSRILITYADANAKIIVKTTTQPQNNLTQFNESWV